MKNLDATMKSLLDQAVKLDWQSIIKLLGTMPPPKSGKSTKASLLLYEDAASLPGELYRQAWGRTSAAMNHLPAGAKTPAGPSCAADPALAAWSEEVRAVLTVEEMVRRASAEPDGSGGRHLRIDGANEERFTGPPRWEILAAVQDLATRPPATPDEYVEILGQALDIELFFSVELGLVADTHTATLELLDSISNLAMYPVHAIKHALNVPRPDQVGLPIQPLVPTPMHGSFPSGHATAAYTCATVLRQLLGADAAMSVRLFSLAKRIAAHRELALVHTSLDTDAGRRLGLAIGSWLNRAATAGCAEHPVWASLYERARTEH